MSEEEMSAERLGDDIGEAIAGNDDRGRCTDRIGNIAGKGRRAESGAADAGDSQCLHIMAAAQRELLQRLAENDRAAAAWRHDHDRAFGGQRVADVESFVGSDDLDVVEQCIERRVALAKGFQGEIAHRRAL